MTALAFIFAIQENDPASFYVLDEIDAALDKKNAEKLAYLIRKYSNHAQYVVISHNDNPSFWKHLHYDPLPKTFEGFLTKNFRIFYESLDLSLRSKIQ